MLVVVVKESAEHKYKSSRTTPMHKQNEKENTQLRVYAVNLISHQIVCTSSQEGEHK